MIFQGRAVWSTLIWNVTLLYGWVQPMGAFNWYISAAMTFYAVTPLCFRGYAALRPAGGGPGARRGQTGRLLVTGVGILLSLVVCQVLMRDGYWNWMGFMYRIPVFLIGVLLGFYVLEERRLGRADVLFWGFWSLLGAGYLLAIALGWSEKPLYLPICHLFLFSTVPMCLVICLLFERLPLGWLRKPLCLLGKYSLEIYLLNVSLFSETAQLSRPASFGPTNRLYYLLSFAANIALGAALHHLVESLRGAWKRLREGGTGTEAQ